MYEEMNEEEKEREIKRAIANYLRQLGVDITAEEYYERRRLEN